MSSMQSEVYEAFRDLGADEDKALRAAAALSKRDEDVVRMDGRLLVLQWMVGFNITISVALLFKVFAH